MSDVGGPEDPELARLRRELEEAEAAARERAEVEARRRAVEEAQGSPNLQQESNEPLPNQRLSDAPMSRIAAPAMTKALMTLLSAVVLVVLLLSFWPSGPADEAEPNPDDSTMFTVAASTTTPPTTLPSSESTEPAQDFDEKKDSTTASENSTADQPVVAACLPASDFQQLVKKWNSTSAELVSSLLDPSISHEEYVRISEQVTPRLQTLVTSMGAETICDDGELKGLMPSLLATYSKKLRGYTSIEQGLRIDSEDLFSQGWHLLITARNEANAISCNLSQDREPVSNFSICSEQSETRIVLAVLQSSFEWGQKSDAVGELQSVLGINPDGVYGPMTRSAHLEALVALGLDTDNVPAIPTAPPTTQPTLPKHFAILTGLKVTETNNQPALVVKIDNAAAAHPQSGLNQADIVFEELIEGNQTRFTAIFQSQEATQIGPIRSVRTGDFDLLRNLNQPLFANSGGNAYTMSMLQTINIVSVSLNELSYGTYSRVADRYSPHNLMSSTQALRSAAAGRGGVPPALLDFRDVASDPPFSGESTSRLELNYGAITVSYSWNSTSDSWKRKQNGLLHLDSDGIQVAPQNLIVQFVDYGQSIAYPFTPEPLLVGQGEAWILSGGNLQQGFWIRSSSQEITRYFDLNGVEMQLNPGKTWISLARTGTATAHP